MEPGELTLVYKSPEWPEKTAEQYASERESDEFSFAMNLAFQCRMSGVMRQSAMIENNKAETNEIELMFPDEAS